MRSTRRPFSSSFLLLGTVAAALGVVVACGSTASEGVAPAPTSSSSTSSSSSSSGATSSSTSSSSSSGGQTDAGDAGPAIIDEATIAAASCSGPVPAGAPRAAALPQYAGACPAIAPGGTYTEFKSSGANRKFLVYTPSNAQPNETFPLVFLWHWLGGSPEGFANKIVVQNVVDTRRIVAVIPAPKSDIDPPFRWPFDATQSQGRVDEELAYFDDMLACVGKALPINKECVASMGVSAGALWTAQLASLRPNRIASFVSLSGGTGGVVRNWTPPSRQMPGLVLWGGKDDMYPSNVPIMNFEKASKNLEGALTSGGHFLVECIHNCGHAVPPFDPPPPGAPEFDMVWSFILKSPFWLPAGASPLKGAALPTPPYPTWCAVGQGNAVARPNDAPCP